MLQFAYDMWYNQKYHKILLHWDLGAGKTHFVKWRVKWVFDYNTKAKNTINNYGSHNINSPTYTYYQIYDNVLHLDMYRLQEYSDFVDKGILDQITNHDFVSVERPKYQSSYADNSRKNIYITKINDNTRQINIQEYIQI